MCKRSDHSKCLDTEQKTTEEHVPCTAMHTLLRVYSFILPLALLRSVTLSYPSFIKSDKATINIERTELDADYVNLHAMVLENRPSTVWGCVFTFLRRW
jgi:hypothetical protein